MRARTQRMTFTFLPAPLGGRFGGRVDPSSDTISHPPPSKSVIRSVTARSRCAPGRRAPGRPAAASRPAGRSVRPPPSTGPAAVGGGARLGCTQSARIISAVLGQAIRVAVVAVRVGRCPGARRLGTRPSYFKFVRLGVAPGPGPPRQATEARPCLCEMRVYAHARACMHTRVRVCAHARACMQMHVRVRTCPARSRTPG